MSRKRKAPVRKVYPDPKFHSEVISKFINFGIIVDLNFGSGVTFFFGCVFFLDINYLPFLVPYKDLLFFLFATPCVSKLPLRI